MQNHLRRAHRDTNPHASRRNTQGPSRHGSSPYPQARQKHTRGPKDSSTQSSASQTQLEQPEASDFSRFQCHWYDHDFSGNQTRITQFPIQYQSMIMMGMFVWLHLVLAVRFFNKTQLNQGSELTFILAASGYSSSYLSSQPTSQIPNSTPPPRSPMDESMSSHIEDALILRE